MSDQVLRLLSSKITDIDFRRDLRQRLRASPYLAQAKMGWLDEAIARGFGYKSHAALLRSSDRDVSEISDAGFRDRMAEFGFAVPENLFRNTVLQLIDGKSDAKRPMPLPARLSESQERQLESTWTSPENVLVCGSNADVNCAMLRELIRRIPAWSNLKPAYILTPAEGMHSEWLGRFDAMVLPYPEGGEEQRRVFDIGLDISGSRCVIDGITQSSLRLARSHMRAGRSWFASMTLESRRQNIDDAIDLYMAGLRVESAPLYLDHILHVEMIDGVAHIVDMTTL